MEGSMLHLVLRRCEGEILPHENAKLGGLGVEIIGLVHALSPHAQHVEVGLLGELEQAVDVALGPTFGEEMRRSQTGPADEQGEFIHLGGRGKVSALSE